MPHKKTGMPRPRLLWYVAGTLCQAGGGERVIGEGLRQFERKGVYATLLLHNHMPNTAALFDGTYSPRVSIVDGYEGDDAEKLLTFRQRVARRIRRSRSLVAAVSSLEPDVIIANSPAECRNLWLSSLLSFRRSPAYVAFVHASPFQFADDVTKYALVFGRHFADIRDADPVYREMISPKPPPMALAKRIRLEIDCLLQYLALRRSRCVFVISQKNRREVELLYGHHNVAVVPAGGFSRVDFTYQQRQDMKATFSLENRGVILSICRLIPKKRVDLAIRAFAELIRGNKDDSYVMVVGGTGPHEFALRSLCQELQIEDKARFIGYIQEQQLRDWYCSCDVFISADNADYDLSVMMALPSGCKVVVSSQYAVPEFLDKMRRFLFVAEPSVQGFAQAIDKAIRTTPAQLSSDDFRELDALTWERYFETVLSLTKLSLGQSDQFTK